MKTLLVLGAGALMMYLMDGERGAQRRAQLRDQVERAKRALSARGTKHSRRRGAATVG
jgi:hypothetical protein